jgi:hypothetical protein
LEKEEKTKIGKDEIVGYEKGCDKLDEDDKEIHCFDSHLRHIHPISRKGKAGAFPRENENSILQLSFEQEKSSDWSLSERNEGEETNSNKVNTKDSPHS